MGKHLRFFKHILFSVVLILLLPVLVFLFEIREISPDFVLIWLSVLCLQYRRKACIGWGFSIGLLLDLTGGGLLGVHAFSMSFAGFIGSLIAGVPHQGKPFSIRLTLMALLSLQDSVFPILFQGFDSGSDSGLLLLRYGLPALIYTLVFGLICHALLSWLEIRGKEVRI